MTCSKIGIGTPIHFLKLTRLSNLNESAEVNLIMDKTLKQNS